MIGESAKKALLKRLKEGDRDAITEVIEDNQRSIFALAYRFTGNREDAKDITQETFMKAIKNIKSFRGDSEISTWLYAIASNLLRDKARKNKGFETTTLDEEIIADNPSPLEQYEMKERKSIVRKALKSLPPEMRTAFLLRFESGLKIAEIAKATGKSEGTIKAQIHDALSRVRKIMGGENEE